MTSSVSQTPGAKRSYDLLTWALVASFVLLGVTVVLTSPQPDRLPTSLEIAAASILIAGGLFRPGRRRAVAILALVGVVTLDQAFGVDGAAQSMALPVMAALVIMTSFRGRQLTAGLMAAWLLGIVAVTIAYFDGEISSLRSPDSSATSVWYLINLLSLTLLTLWWAAKRWGGAIEEATEARTRAELEEQRYRRLFEQSPDGILVSDDKMNMLDANPAFCELLGYSVEELRAMPYEALLDPEDAAGFRAMKDVILVQAADVWTSDRRMRTKDGALRVVELCARPQPDGTGQITVRDVTARKAAESELRRMAAALEQADDLVRISDAAGMIQYVNPGFERITGYTSEESVGRTGASLLRSGVQSAAFYEDLDAAIAEGRPWTGRLVSRRKDGSHFNQDLRLSPLRDERGRRIGLVEVGRDVTHEVVLEGQLRQAAKMEAIGHLAGGVAHDFNNILTAIRGYAELVRRGLPETMERDRDDLDEIIHAADRASRLTNQLLTFARRTVLEPRVLDPAEVVHEMAPMLRRLLGEHIRLDNSGSVRGLAHIKADPAQLEQVLLNLAVNARDAMVGGGRLVMSTAEVSLVETDLRRHPEGRPGHFVMLAISDTGEGISGDVEHHIFEPFFTTKEPDKGTGMGLATVLGIVKMSDGWIEVDSKVGEGTTFKLYFPALPFVAGPDRAAEPADTPRGSETVLLVEDADQVRAFGRRCLMHLGYQVLEAPGPGEARSLAGSYPGQIDLLLSDVVMPGMQGPELASQILEIRPEIKILYSSGFTQDAKITQSEGVGYLPKPYTLDALARAVRSVLDNERVWAEAGADATEE